MKKLLCIFLVLILVGCAPQKEQPKFEEVVEEEKTPEFADLFETADTIYFIQNQEEEEGLFYIPGSTEPILILEKYGLFQFWLNLGEGMDYISGFYREEDDTLVLTVQYIAFRGFLGDDITSITMSYSEEVLEIISADTVSGKAMGFCTRVGSRFILTERPPNLDEYEY